MQRGFTVIELMVVVVVLAILATLAGPSFVDMMDRRRLVNQAEAITELVQLARLEALKHSTVGADRSVAFTVSPGPPWYVGLKGGSTGCNGTASDCVVNEGGTPVTRLVTGSDCGTCTMTSPSASSTLVFSFRGLVEGATDVPITVRSARGRELRINVSRIGRVGVCAVGGLVSGYPSC